MKQSQKKQLQKLKRGYKEYGYIALRDYKPYHHLKALPKIISLKNKNRVLCARRKSLMFNLVGLSQKDFNTISILCTARDIAILSEKIGKNSNKIQRIRSQYSKFSDKWIAEKLAPKDDYNVY